MADYLMLSKLTEKGRKSIRERPDRIKEVNKEVEALGVNIVSQYALLGPYDFATIIRAGDNWEMNRIAIELGARGTMETLTMPALEVDDFITLLKLRWPSKA
ncbi:MAG: GYD domain-containing protein [Chloroflexi bacterium]|nr:GYD domain-containing protein [Chloroflexota bacterium]